MTLKNSFEIKKYEFSSELFSNFKSNHYVDGLWPLVYILSDGKCKEAYVGETTDAMARMSAHLKNNSKNKLTAVHLITSNKFNKSATLDIESNLIKYISGDGQFELLNGNLGLANHTYYQKKEIYWDIFKTIWSELKSEGITKHTLEHIDNSDLFKYSPYKSLTTEQKNSIINIIKYLLNKQINNIMVEGGAGTGKTILATYLFKLLNSDLTDFNIKEFGDEEKYFLKLAQELKKEYPNPKMALVVPMSSFRSTLKKVFGKIKGLNSKMVIGPAELANQKYDIVIVDESHRLRKRVNLGAYFGSFDLANKKLKLDKLKNNELDWVIKQGGKKILFYDQNQSIKPSDVNKVDFDNLKKLKGTKIEHLQSQFRVKGGNDYVSYIDKLLNCKIKPNEKSFYSDKYEFLFFSSLEEMIGKIKENEERVKLSRTIAGYSWKWASKKKDTHDIEIDGLKLKWNGTSNDWVNSPDAINEIGCIHTTQGYDLNYAAIIFGNEISYDPTKNEIIIKEENYFDINGKQSIKDPTELKAYIINIYRTMMLRGIKGTYIYACDPHLRKYFEEHIQPSIKVEKTKVLQLHSNKKPNTVPFYDVSIAAGNFSQTNDSSLKWLKVPKVLVQTEDYFVCQVIGESMNKVIPNGSFCLFKKDTGGSREGKIVLVEHYKIQDSDYGRGYTIKTYHGEKNINSESWSHSKIVLKPKSDQDYFQDIVLEPNETDSLKIVGIFIEVINMKN
jgi:DUF2075 family protein